MKRNLLIGIIGGAAVGAAASYLLNSENRRNLTSGLGNRLNSLMGKDAEDEFEGTEGGGNAGGATASANRGGNTGGMKRRGTTGRRG